MTVFNEPTIHDKPLESSKSQFLRKFHLLLDDQLKRKEIIFQIQEIARQKNYELHNKPQIANESYRFEWFVATSEPSLVDLLYYLYFWVLLKGKYLLDDMDEEQVNKLKKKKSIYALNNVSSASLEGTANGSSDSLYIESPSKINNIANHHSTTRFEKDILKAKQSVNDLRSQFAKIIDAESKEASKTSPSTTPRKTKFSNGIVTPTGSPITKKFNINNIPPNNNSASGTNSTNNNSPTHRVLVHKVSELNLMDSPYIKNVLRFKFEMSTYLNVLVNNYDLNNEILPLEFLLRHDFLPTSKIIFKNNESNLDTASRILGYEHLLFIKENPIDRDCSDHLKFVYNLLVNHLDSGMVWDFHAIYQTSGNLQSGIKSLPDRIQYFQNFNKTLIYLIFQFYKDKNKREGMIKEFNLNPKHHIKIDNLKLNYSILKFSEIWKNWSELDFVSLNNFIFCVPEGKSSDIKRMIAKRTEFTNLKSGNLMSYYAWDTLTDNKVELHFTKP